MLLVAGDGPLRPTLAGLARELGVAGRVRFAGQVPHAALPELYGAADALVLASEREGWPNVLLEAIACGTPVIAAPVWACRRLSRRPQPGYLSTRARPGRSPGPGGGSEAPPRRAPPRAATPSGSAGRRPRGGAGPLPRGLGGAAPLSVARSPPRLPAPGPGRSGWPEHERASTLGNRVGGSDPVRRQHPPA